MLNMRAAALASSAIVAALLPTALPAQRVDTVRVGSPSLAGATLVPGRRAIESVLRPTPGGADTRISATTLDISRTTMAGIDVYVLASVHAPVDGDTTTSITVVRAADFALVHHKVKADHDSAAATATDGYLSAWVVLPGEPVRLMTLTLDHPVFPVEGQMPWLLPLLPFAEDYVAAVPRFSEWDGGETWQTITVVGSERITQGGRAYECWTIDAGPLGPPGYRAMHWIDKRTRRILQSALRGEGGGTEYWALARD